MDFYIAVLCDFFPSTMLVTYPEDRFKFDYNDHREQVLVVDRNTTEVVFEIPASRVQARWSKLSLNECLRIAAAVDR